MSSTTSHNSMNTIPTTENEKRGDTIPQTAFGVGEKMSGGEILVLDEAVLHQKEEDDDNMDGAPKQGELGNISPKLESAISGDREGDRTLPEVNSAHSDMELEVDGSLMGGGERSVETDAFLELKSRGVVGPSEILEVKFGGAVPSPELGASGTTEEVRTILEVNAMPKPEMGQTMGGCGTLEKLSPEVRRMIWKLLLVNPKLGNVQPGYEWMISEEVYDLWPKALRTCWQIYAEASEVLYGCNTFFFVCVSDEKVHYYHDLYQRCPITRHYVNSRNSKTRKVWSRCIESMQKFRWRVIIGDINIRTSMFLGRWNLSPFCREICNASLPPISLEILIIEKRSSIELVQALRILRNIGELSFANAKAADCPEFYGRHSDRISYRNMDDTLEAGFYHPISVSLRVELKSLVTGNSPVDLLCNMNQCLLNYAKTYERYKPYRDDMGINESKHGETLHQVSQWARHSGLDKCNTAVDNDDHTAFKAERRLILQYLDRQYYCILEASRSIHLFIGIHKRRRGLLDIHKEKETFNCSISRMCDDSTMQGYAAKGCVLLEAYADALKRELTLSAKVTIARMRAEFEGYYSSKPREIAIQAVIEPMTNTQDGWNYDAWADNFIISFDDMENQLEEIQDARRDIFHCDISSDWGCDIDMKLGKTNRKRVDWTVNGPGVVFYDVTMRADNDDDDD
ncbi:hypothetical protein EAF04_007456 [Stromatinia cepivora]|nr:hypothetical protein EAF04_007456 [Stromatinia cepivora]